MLIVTEPNVSALHDLERAAELTAHFKIKTLVCINKADINPEVTDIIKKVCSDKNIEVAGEIGYDADFLKSQKKGESIVSYSNGPAVQSIKKIHAAIKAALK